MIRPTGFNPDGTVQVWHDEGGHGGAVAVATLVQPPRLDGQPDLTYCALPCPVCPSVSFHPAVGDATARDLVQRLFVRRLQARAAGRTWLQARALVRALIQQQDGGLDRWQLANVQTEAD